MLGANPVWPEEAPAGALPERMHCTPYSIPADCCLGYRFYRCRLSQGRCISIRLTGMAQPEKQMHTLMAYLRVVRLSPALPGRSTRDTPSLSRHPTYGMEPASPDRHFASRLYLRQRVGFRKASPQYPISLTPWRSAPRQRKRQERHHRSPSFVTRRPSLPGGTVLGG